MNAGSPMPSFKTQGNLSLLRLATFLEASKGGNSARRMSACA